jgi:uncharacterized lipoprotein YddW (UPF0748 family)
MVLRFRFLFLLTFCLLGAGAYSALPVPPLPAREFRGLWIASVANIDWPSEKGLDRTRQKAELKALFDQALRVHAGALVRVSHREVRPVAGL